MGLVTEAIKRMFSRNTTNAASQSGARVPIVNVNGAPIGNDSLANLASVLGGVASIANASNGGLDNIKTTGVYRFSDSTFGNGCYGICICKVLDSVFAYQECWEMTKNKKYFRLKYIQSQNWNWDSNWQKVESTDLT